MKSNDREDVTPEELKYAFLGTSFGPEKPEETLKWSLLKVASGYATGGTAKAILRELKLISKAKTATLTKRGQYCLWCRFNHGYKK